MYKKVITMEPFKVSPHLSTLLDNYPDANLIIEAARNGGQPSRSAIARLWLSEGIPFAFRKAPALYDIVRAWLASRIGVNPKEIHLTGSGRIGQSMKPSKLGTTFGDHSDLDLFIVSEALFERARKDFNTWSYEFESNSIQAKNENINKLWVENVKRGQRSLQRNFLDTDIIPNWTKYSTIQEIAQSMWLLKAKLDATENAPSIKSASVRCYKDWESYVNQVSLNLG